MDVFIAGENGAASAQLSGLVSGDWNGKLSTHGNLAE